MESIAFTIPGRVGGKGRPRAVARGGFVRMYTPPKTASTEAMVKHFAAEAMQGRAAFDGPVVLDITVSINTPASWSKRQKAAAFYVTTKPDVDNVVKLIGDALNGIVWQDDKQISDLCFRRRYNDHAPESVEVKVFTPGKGGLGARYFCPKCQGLSIPGTQHDCQPVNPVGQAPERVAA